MRPLSKIAHRKGVLWSLPELLRDVVHSSAIELSSRIAQKNPHMDRRIIILKNQIAAGLKQRWTVAEMAKAVNLSNSHLRKIFHDELGISPAKFVREIRLQESRKLLENEVAVRSSCPQPTPRRGPH